ncbi:MAG: HupE/UreJ family protein [Bacteroidota bacterium]|nr:HupE/UreJ family protein [Bacteroidota bacterium]
MENFTLFLRIGITHILEGYDHILFLAGLIIVTTSFRSILKIASAFTVTHSTTLILSALGILSINPSITETLIAFSIAYVGIENLFIKDKNQRYRWLVAGSFGFIHGAGFSGHLTELLKSMLGMGNIWAPLVGFNIGIELGQVIIIALVFPMIFFVRKFGKERIFVPAASLAIAASGTFLVVWRVWSL